MSSEGFSPHNHRGVLTGFQQTVTDRLPDGLTDKSDYVWMERNFPRIQIIGKLHTVILVGIFSINLADA